MVREKSFIGITYVAVKLEKMLIKICNLLENRIPEHLIIFYVSSKQKKFFLDKFYLRVKCSKAS